MHGSCLAVKAKGEGFIHVFQWTSTDSIRIDGLLLEDVPSDNELSFVHTKNESDHILVNDSFGVVRIMDWAWNQTTVGPGPYIGCA